MDFNFNERQKTFCQTIQKFVECHVRPIAAQIDQDERFPRETLEKLAQANLMGIPVPVQYGGAGLDTLTYIIAIEELSRACAATGVTVSTHISLACYPIYTYGTEEQKEKYLRPLAKGERLGAFA